MGQAKGSPKPLAPLGWASARARAAGSTCSMRASSIYARRYFVRLRGAGLLGGGASIGVLSPP